MPPCRGSSERDGWSGREFHCAPALPEPSFAVSARVHRLCRRGSGRVAGSLRVSFANHREGRSMTFRRRRSLVLEELEARNLLSTSIPLDPVNWTALGPAPIANGQTPGRQPVSGRISAIAADPNDANVI